MKSLLGEMKITYKRPKASLKITKIDSSENLAKAARELIGKDLEYIEYFVLFALDKSLNIIGYKMFEGGQDFVAVDISRILQFIILSNASVFAVAHNHPSGNLSPSNRDENMTAELKEAGNAIKTSLIDHVIVTKNSHYSFKDSLNIL